MPAPAPGSLELAVLLAVARLHDGAHGLAVRADVSERLGHDYSVGAIYTTLQRLEDKRLISSKQSEPLPVRGGRSRREFRVTAPGRKAITAAERASAQLWAGVASHPIPEPS